MGINRTLVKVAAMAVEGNHKAVFASKEFLTIVTANCKIDVCFDGNGYEVNLYNSGRDNMLQYYCESKQQLLNGIELSLWGL